MILLTFILLGISCGKEDPATDPDPDPAPQVLTPEEEHATFKEAGFFDYVFGIFVVDAEGHDLLDQRPLNDPTLTDYGSFFYRNVTVKSRFPLDRQLLPAGVEPFPPTIGTKSIYRLVLMPKLYCEEEIVIDWGRNDTDWGRNGVKKDTIGYTRIHIPAVPHIRENSKYCRDSVTLWLNGVRLEQDRHAQKMIVIVK